MKNDERWLSVEGYEGRYEVSDFGRIRSIDPRKKVAEYAIRVLCLGSGGLLQVTLCRNGTKKSFLVNRLVLTAFKGPAPAGKVARHVDHDVTNNLLKNLTWGPRYSRYKRDTFHVKAES